MMSSMAMSMMSTMLVSWYQSLSFLHLCPISDTWGHDRTLSLFPGMGRVMLLGTHSKPLRQELDETRRNSLSWYCYKIFNNVLNELGIRPNDGKLSADSKTVLRLPRKRIFRTTVKNLNYKYWYYYCKYREVRETTLMSVLHHCTISATWQHGRSLQVFVGMWYDDVH